MKHPSDQVEAALVRLNDELCSWERSTGRQSILILREQGGYELRTASGKPTIPDDIDDEMLWFLSNLNEGVCPHCKTQVKQRQVGHCVYGTCGHRLYQGTVNPKHAA